MSSFATCGCEVFSGNDMIPVEYGDEDINPDTGKFEPVVITAVFCRECARIGEAEGWLRILEKGTG